MGTLTGLSGEYVTFDKKVRKSNFGLIAANLPNWQFWRINDANATGRCDSTKRSHANQGRNHPSDSNRRENPEILSDGNDAKAFLTRLSRISESSERSRKVFEKSRCDKDESDGCIDTWIEVMKLHFEEEDLTERQECSALTSNLEGTALN